MIRRLCRECGSEMTRELMPDGVGFYCRNCESYGSYDECDMTPYCPECGTQLEFCSKCSQAFFCATCGGIVSSKRIVWKPA